MTKSAGGSIATVSTPAARKLPTSAFRRLAALRANGPRDLLLMGAEMMGFGGLVSVIGGLLFLIVAWKSMRARQTGA